MAAVKTGMLATAATVDAVAARPPPAELPNLVVDPVMVASSGDRLLDAGAEEAYRERLFPHAAVVTPNLREAEVLLGRTHPQPRRPAARPPAPGATGARRVVVKGGHPAGDPTGGGRRLGRQGTVYELRAPWVDTPNTHGTGCSFAAATAAHLAQGDDLRDALASREGLRHPRDRRRRPLAPRRRSRPPGPLRLADLVTGCSWTLSAARG